MSDFAARLPLTGHPDIDRQHFGLVDLLKHLKDQGDRPCEAKVLFSAWTILANHLHDHFVLEERLMLGIGYDRRSYEEHVAAHATIRQSAERLMAQYRRSEVTEAGPLVAMLESWLTGHIPVHDQPIADAVSQRDRTRSKTPSLPCVTENGSPH